MIQLIARDWSIPGRRRVSAFLLAICLNLAIVPCTMALEVVEQGHDCCPPDVQIEAVECCELGDANVDARFGSIELRDAPNVDVLPAYTAFQVSAPALPRHVASVDPPDPPRGFPPLYDLYCVYLK